MNRFFVSPLKRFLKTENKETEISLIPIENSQAGKLLIFITYYLCQIYDHREYFKARHHLLGCSGSL